MASNNFSPICHQRGNHNIDFQNNTQINSLSRYIVDLHQFIMSLLYPEQKRGPTAETTVCI